MFFFLRAALTATVVLFTFAHVGGCAALFENKLIYTRMIQSFIAYEQELSLLQGQAIFINYFLL